MQKSLKSISSNIRFNITQPGVLQLINILFSYCSTTTEGGAIYLNNNLLSLNCLFSSFSNCNANDRGGGICSHNSNTSILKSNCFFNCSSLNCNSIMYRGMGYSISKIEYNLTDDFSPYFSKLSNTIHSLNNILINQINCSYSIIDGDSSNFRIGGYKNSYCIFSQFSNSIGTSIFTCYFYSKNLLINLNYLNFINNTYSVGLIQIDRNISNPLIQNCNFNINSIKSIIELKNGGSGFPFFENCFFNIPFNLSYHSLINTINNSFNNININYHSIEFLNTYQCWNGSMFNYTNFYIPHFYLTILIQFIIIF